MTVAARTITRKISGGGQNLVYSEITKILVLASVMCKEKRFLCYKGQQPGTEKKIGYRLVLTFLVSSGRCRVLSGSRKKNMLLAGYF